MAMSQRYPSKFIIKNKCTQKRNLLDNISKPDNTYLFDNSECHLPTNAWHNSSAGNIQMVLRIHDCNRQKKKVNCNIVNVLMFMMSI